MVMRFERRRIGEKAPAPIAELGARAAQRFRAVPDAGLGGRAKARSEGRGIAERRRKEIVQPGGAGRQRLPGSWRGVDQRFADGRQFFAERCQFPAYGPLVDPVDHPSEHENRQAKGGKHGDGNVERQIGRRKDQTEHENADARQERPGVPPVHAAKQADLPIHSSDFCGAVFRKRQIVSKPAAAVSFRLRSGRV